MQNTIYKCAVSVTPTVNQRTSRELNKEVQNSNTAIMKSHSKTKSTRMELPYPVKGNRQ